MFAGRLTVRTVAFDAGIEAQPGGVCAGMPGEAFIKYSATAHSTQMLDPSHCRNSWQR